MVPSAVQDFRREYREHHISPRYSGLLHFAFTSVGSLAVVALALAQVRDLHAVELLTVPVTFLFANYVEYRGHKGPMHRSTRGLALLFERHTEQHHRFFTDAAMNYESRRDYKMVLFPPVMLLFFLGAIAAPVGALLFLVASHNVAWLYVATAMGYFLTYEWLHFCHHLPEHAWIARQPFLKSLRSHHQRHHDPSAMTGCNFNITFPICDTLFGTRRRPLTLALALLTLGPAVARPQALSPEEARISAAVDRQLDSSVALLERLVSINSGTFNPAGVKAVADILIKELDALGFRARWVPMDHVRRAGHVVAERDGTGARVLVLGHLDTVFEPSHRFQGWSRHGAIAEGPGVSDMKGGLVVLLHALKAQHEAGALDGRSITVVLTGDEENSGDPMTESRKDLVEAARRSRYALEFEPCVQLEGRDMGTIARRGALSWTLRAKGSPGHSSGIFGARVGAGGQPIGHGAIYELSRILWAFHEELREPGVTYSVSLVLGGDAVKFEPLTSSGTAEGKSNIIPREAVAVGDLRASSQSQGERIQARMREIVGKSLPGAGATIEFDDGLPPMEATPGNAALLARLNEVNRDLGLPAMAPLDPMRRGGGDISVIAPLIDSLSGLGIVGFGAHAEGETADLDSLPRQTRRAALLIHPLAR